MKQFFIIILSILLLSTCENSEHMQFEKLQLIDSLAESHPDSAVAMIKTINRVTLLGNDNKYYFDLLEIRANDKTYIAHTSDSAILSIINYFENHDFNNLLPVAYYYGGRVYSDFGDAPQALEFFHKALDCPNINTCTKAVTYSQIASIYNSQQVFDLAIPAYKKAIELNFRNNNITNAIYNMRDLGSVYSKQGSKDSALVLYNQIIKESEKINNTKLTSSIKHNIAELYIFQHDYKKAYNLLNSIRDILPIEDSTKIANTFAHLHYRLNNNDSTIFYCSKLIKSKNLNVQLNGYNILSNLYIKQNDITKATPYIIKSQLLSDSISNIETPQKIRQLSSIYNYQIRERDNNRLKQELQDNEIKIILLSGSILIIILIAILICFIIHKRKRIIKLKLQNVELLLKESNNISETTIIQNKEIISKLESQINSIHRENESLIEELESQKKLLELKNEQALLIKSQNECAMSTFKNDSFVKEIKNRLQNYPINSNIITESELILLTEKISDLFPTFITKLNNLPFNISLNEFRVSLLLKTNFSPREISRLTNHSESSVSITRIRLYKKLTGNNGRTTDWDNFISNI